MPRISIIIPTYNRSNALVRAVRSIIAQDLADIEIIIVDDCSQDNTIECIRDLNIPNISLIRNEINKGAQYCRNIGVNYAKSELLAFLDSDDEFLDGSLPIRLTYFENHRDCSVLVCGYEVAYRSMNDSIIRSKNILFSSYTRFNIKNKIVNNLGLSPTSTLMVKKSCLEQIGFFDEKLFASQDDDIFIRLCDFYQIDLLKQPLVRLNMHAQDRISTNPKRFAIGYYQLFKKHENFLKNNTDLLHLLWNQSHINFLLKSSGVTSEKLNPIITKYDFSSILYLIHSLIEIIKTIRKKILYIYDKSCDRL